MIQIAFISIIGKYFQTIAKISVFTLKATGVDAFSGGFRSY